MALIVKIANDVTSNQIIGTLHQYGAQFWDPLTGTNLNVNNPQSADLSGFSGTQLVNIAHGLTTGVLTLVSGTAPTDSAVYAKYGLYTQAGAQGAPIGGGVTGVAANEF